MTGRQGARSYGLRAALAPAKLYQSNNRNAEGRDILGPALEGFSPTPEFPEGLALLAEIKQADARPCAPENPSLRA